MGQGKFIPLMVLLATVSCGPTARVLHEGSEVGISHVRRQQKAAAASDSAERTDRVVARSGDELAETDTLGMERIAAVRISAVEVRTSRRVVPERGGRVLLGYDLVIPRHLLSHATEIDIRPVAVAGTDTVRLGSTVIRGERFMTLRDRELWQASRFASGPDSLQAAGRFLRMDLRQGSRLDSMLARPRQVTVHCEEWVRVGEASEIELTVTGAVHGIDSRTGPIAGTDTLRYSVSSLLAFADRRTRYVEKLVYRFRRESGKFDFRFRAGRSGLEDTVASNRAEKARLEAFLREAVADTELFILDSVVVSASASPEGSETSNARLSSLRAEALSEWIASQGLVPRGCRITSHGEGEAWGELRRLMAQDAECRMEGILRIVDAEDDADTRERCIRTRFPSLYRSMRERFYPALRQTRVEAFMQRRNMTRDTVRTEVPDERYNHAVEALLARRYMEAATILRPYGDLNTAIAFLSLGFDRDAMEILGRLPVTAEREYLLGVACLRTGLTSQGRRHAEEACRMNPRLRFRMGLDPEMEALQ